MDKQQIDPVQFQKRSEFVFNSWFVIAPAGLAYRDVFTADPWRDVAAKEATGPVILRQFDILRIRASDGAYDFLATVVGRRKTDKTIVLQLFPKTAAVARAPAAIAPPGVPKSRADALDVFGLHASATDDLIAKSASVLRQSWHPDHATSEADRTLRTEKCANINTALDVLKRKAA
jgi:hypothetical protein